MTSSVQLNGSSQVAFGASLFYQLIVLIALSLLAGCERYALDRQMEALCRKDAGVRVYETVTLSQGDYVQMSKYATSRNRENYYGPEYRYVYRRENIVGSDSGPERGEGRLSRSYWAIYRRSDGRLLGENIAYSRGGGDYWFLLGVHPSSSYCPEPRIDLGQSVFMKGT